MAITFRDTIKAISPPWLQRGVAEKILYAVAVHLDLITDGIVAGVKSRFPGVYGYESLTLIGRERRIRKGRDETSALYAGRLCGWLDSHALRGGPHELLRQVYYYFIPNDFDVDLVYRSGRRFLLNEDGDISHDDVAWEPDATPEQWARWWLFYHWPDTILSDGLWSDAGTWTDGGVWNIALGSLDAAEVHEIRSVPREWNAGHAIGHIVIINGDDELWDYPIGDWGDAGDWTNNGAVTLSLEG